MENSMRNVNIQKKLVQKIMNINPGISESKYEPNTGYSARNNKTAEPKTTPVSST
jgi:hypothetical protein